MTETDLPSADAAAPSPPKSVRDTGLPLALLADLTAKALHGMGRVHLPVLTTRLRLSVAVLREVLDHMIAVQQADIAWRGDTDLDVQYQLTPAGRQRAAEALLRCRYAGPAPVPLEVYREVVQRQSLRHGDALRPSPEHLHAAFADDGVGQATRDLLGAAMQCGRPLLLHGPSGSGKTTLACKLGRLQQGVVAVPYALAVGDDIVLVHDPLLHAVPSPLQLRQFSERPIDARWARSLRPVVHVGAELGREMLELRQDPATGVYHAPVQLLANNGMLIVDDLGRQRVGARELLDRWSGALDQHVDHLHLPGGQKCVLPFDVALVLATNLAPQAVLDDAALRRIAYKAAIGPLAEPQYRSLFRHQCRVSRVVFDDLAMDHLLQRLHADGRIPLLASVPRDLLARVHDFASLAGHAPRLSIPAVEQAWASMFASAS